MRLFIFGSTGDLVKRKVIPALQDLKEELQIYAFGRRDFTDETYREFICQGTCTSEFAERICYRRIDLSNEGFLEPHYSLFEKTKINFIYIALPPENIDSILFALIKLKEKGIKFRVLIEKPFGKDSKHALELKKIISEGDLDEEVYLSDHYLFKKNIMDLKPKNFKSLRLISLENLGLEGRNTYYDEIGALKDMVQSHFFNIVFKLFDNPAVEFDSFEVSDIAKVQYTDGNGESYEKELGRKSKTETFVRF